jgi:hypothetical protein
MTPTLTHCAINADDVDASLRFYGALFGWRFEPHGPPGFFRTQPETGPIVALQQRRDLGGVRATGFECTVAVPGVGDLIFFEDPSGVVAGAMEHVS